MNQCHDLKEITTEEHDCFYCSTSDAKLIALAPEMAEVILKLGVRSLSCPTHTRLFGDSFDTFSASCMECRTIGEVQMLAKKLRAIGVWNE